MQHTAQAELSYTTPAGARTQYAWDGQNLAVNGNVDAAYNAQNATQGTQNATHGTQNANAAQSQDAEVYELLNSLKWFEYHFIKTQMMLESEVYSFDTAEQYQRELDQKLKEADHKDQTTSIDTKEL